MRPTDPRAVLALVAEWFYVDPADITGGSRRRRHVTARTYATRILHDRCGYSWPEACALLGRYSNGTNALRFRARDIPADDPILGALLAFITTNQHKEIPENAQ